MKYRADIDGLRAVSVIAVIAFHLKFVTGGFVGVDVFFVISGYLIGGQIFSEMRDGTWSIAHFYERRARRILPALIAVIIGTWIVGVFVLHPPAMVSLAKSTIAAAFFAANIYFYDASNYFAPSAETTPLLHLWSLGVEEQYYIAFPLMMMLVVGLASKRRRAATIVMLTALCAASIVISQASLLRDPPASFYLLPSRAFELLLGVLIAIPGFPIPSRGLSACVGVIGIPVLGGAIVMLTPETLFPGFVALIPCGAATLLLWSGSNPDSLAARLLRLPALGFVGRISYSLYLVHWPLIVFGPMMFPSAAKYILTAGTLALAFSLAIVMHRWIEQPFRRNGRWSSHHGLAFCCVGLFALLLPAVLTIQQSGFRGRFEDRIASILAYETYDMRQSYRSGTCFLDPDQDFNAYPLNDCFPKAADILLWGDSHAAHLSSGLAEQMGPRLGMLSASLCPPVPGVDIPQRPRCKNINENILKTVIDRHPNVALLAARWRMTPDRMTELVRTIDILRSHHISVIVLGDGPLFKAGVPAMISAKITRGEDDNTAHAGDIDMSYLESSDDEMTKRFSASSGVAYISIFKAVCPQKTCQLSDGNDRLFYYDKAHLTAEGSTMFASRLSAPIRDAIRILSDIKSGN